MIERIFIKNYRQFQELEFTPDLSLNIIVGDNEAGKSTLLNAIAMAIEGRSNGRPLEDDLNPYWFNTDVVDDYFDQRIRNKNVEPPFILIEVYMSKTDQPQTLRGRVNSRSEDCPGFAIEVKVDPDYITEFEKYVRDCCKLIKNAENATFKTSQHASKTPTNSGFLNYIPRRTLPTEYYHVTWRGFDNRALYRRPKDMNILVLNNGTTKLGQRANYSSKQLFKECIGPKTNAEISVRHRQERNMLTAELLADINREISETHDHFGDRLTLEIDQSSASSWDTAVIPHVNGLPFSDAGQGQQIIVQTSLTLSAMSRNPRLILIEEPESHLSHTSLFHVLERIERLSRGRQVFITTHSSFVLNRLGLKSLKLLHDGQLTTFSDLSEETELYFQKQTGYDTLRIVLARTLVIVEGPSDELVFRKAYEDRFARKPELDWIDILAQGTRYARALELCAALDRNVVVLRDNDGQSAVHWTEPVSQFLSDSKRKLFVSDPAHGKTLEPQMIYANHDRVSDLKAVVGCSPDMELDTYMTNNKTEWALRVAVSNSEFAYPDYINQALDFLNDLTQSD